MIRFYKRENKQRIMDYKYTDFDHGWWTCFITFCETIECYASPGDNTITQMLDGAGVKEEELDFIIEYETMNDKLKAALVDYRQRMPKK